MTKERIAELARVYPDTTREQLAACGYEFARKVSGVWLGIMSLTYGRAQLCVGCTNEGHEESYEYESHGAAVQAMWNFYPATMSEPTGWTRARTKDGKSWRRRPDGTPVSEEVRA